MTPLAHVFALALAHGAHAAPPSPAPAGDARGLFGWSEALWVSVSAIATAAAAAVTAAMAVFTGLLAAETKAVESATERMSEATESLARSARDERAQAERHHREMLEPVVVLVAECRFFSKQNRQGGNARDIGTICLTGTISNVGGGPALQLQLLFSPEGFRSGSRFLGVLGANQTSRLSIKWEQPDPGTPSRLLRFKTLLTFESIFRESGYTLQRSATGSAEDIETTRLVSASLRSQEIEAVVKSEFPGGTDPIDTDG